MFKLDEIRTYEILFLVSPFRHGCDLEIKVIKISMKSKAQQSEPLCKVCQILLKLCPRKGEYLNFCFKPIITKPDFVQQDWVRACKALSDFSFAQKWKMFSLWARDEKVGKKRRGEQSGSQQELCNKSKAVTCPRTGDAINIWQLTLHPHRLPQHSAGLCSHGDLSSWRWNPRWPECEHTVGAR